MKNIGIVGGGYVAERLLGHPRADKRGMVLQHILVAERALGKPLPCGAEVHHVDGDKRNNKGKNLVICESLSYHLKLHARQRALAACGNADWLPCVRCHVHDAPVNMTVRPFRSGTRAYHKACEAHYVREWKKRTRL